MQTNHSQSLKYIVLFLFIALGLSGYSKDISDQMNNPRIPNYATIHFKKTNHDDGNTYLVKNRLGRTKKLRDGYKFKVPKDDLVLILRYKVKEGKIVKTYGFTVEAKVEGGIHYELRYYASEGNNKRRYYLFPITRLAK